VIVDTSALLAILQGEPERRVLLEAIEAAETCLISAASMVETSIVIECRYGTNGLRDLDLLLDRARIKLAPVDTEQAYEARRAYSRYGKGRHRAGLNYGDCIAYALAVCMAQPLLFKGDDFAQTDVLNALQV
jgi:ribonuclease VapC